jgi:hypothetical protein
MFILYLAITTCVFVITTYVLLRRKHAANRVMFSAPPILSAAISVAGLLALSFAIMTVIVEAMMR